MQRASSLKSALANVLRLAAILMSMPVAAFAGPNYGVPTHISGNLYRPEDVAISNDYQMYVADPGQDMVFIYNQENQLSGLIPVAAPSAVAVSQDGTLYAASGKDLSVEIISAGGQSLGFLGQGKNEFKLPRNIAIDPATGNVMVVDQLDHGIKVYTADGAFLNRIDDTPNLPIDVAIHNNEMFVLDQPLLEDDKGNLRGARIMIFDLNGNQIAWFGSFGGNDNQLVSPRALAIDKNGTLFISDVFHGVIRGYDIWGNLLSTIQDQSRELFSPKGLAIDASGRLAVASSLTASIRLYHLNGYAPASGNLIGFNQPAR